MFLAIQPSLVLGRSGNPFAIGLTRAYCKNHSLKCSGECAGNRLLTFLLFGVKIDGFPAERTACRRTYLPGAARNWSGG